MIDQTAPPILCVAGPPDDGRSLRPLFAEWMMALGFKAELDFQDMPLAHETRRFRELVEKIRDDDRIAGAWIMDGMHDIYRNCGDLFDEISDEARTLGEIDCIFKHDGKMSAGAEHPKTASTVLEDLVPAGHWERHRSDFLCFGAGRACLAVTVNALVREPAADRPARIIMADTDSGLIETLGHQHDRFKPIMPIQYHRVHGPADNDLLVAGMRPFSLIVNASGLGENRRGSPLGNNVIFPDRSIVWDADTHGNGELIKQANAQADTRTLKVEGSERYMQLGLLNAIETVLNQSIPSSKRDELLAHS